MNPLQEKVQTLFEIDRQLNALEKALKTKNAHYQHMLLKNSDRIFSDTEVLQIHAVYQELQQLKTEKITLQEENQKVRAELLEWLAPLSGGRWVHETNDPLHPHWEFWVEEEELKFARMNGVSYA